MRRVESQDAHCCSDAGHRLADFEQKRLVEMPVTDIRCANEGYGL